jgi:hypothetical protein
MSCRHLLDDASAFLDGQLPPDRRDDIRKHLEHCPECATEIRSLEAATGFVTARLRELHPPADLWRRIESKIEPPRREAGRFPWLASVLEHRWRFATAALLAAIVGAGAYSLVQYRESRATLERYMSEYVEYRRAGRPAPARQRVLSPARGKRVIRVQFTENPFAEDDILGPFENPFQAEGRE